MHLNLHGPWLDMFVQVFSLCGVQAGDACAVLSETATRREFPPLAEVALLRLGARPFHIVMPARPLTAPLVAGPPCAEPPRHGGADRR